MSAPAPSHLIPTLPENYRPMTIASGVRASAGRSPDKVALAEGARTLTYTQLVQRIDRVAAAALGGLGLEPGQHTALMSPNCLEFIEIVAGLSDAGTPPALISSRLSGPEMAFICNDAQARVLFVHESLEDLVRSADLQTVERIVVIGKDYEDWLGQAHPPPALRPVQEWEVFSIPYTAGTTGKPKGVLLSHRSRVLTFFSMAVEYGCYSADDRALAIAPLFHGAGFAFAMAPVYFGGFCEILPAFEPERVLQQLAELDISNTFMVPTHFNALFALEQPVLDRVRLPALTTIICNAAPLPQATKERVVGYFGEGILHETYGSTEGGIVTNLKPADQLRKVMCVGLPFPANRVRILDGEGQDIPRGEVGELFSNSPTLFNGYWGQPQATAESMRDGWFSAGDMARQDEEGYIYLVDRKKDVIISGGVNIYPREIEEVLHAHPAVAEAAAVGVADDYWGEAVRAVVVLRQGAEATEQELLDHCAASLARYKLPKSMAFTDTLPRNAAGKVLRRQLREEANRSSPGKSP